MNSEKGLRLGVGADDIGLALKDYICAQLTKDLRLAFVRDFSEVPVLAVVPTSQCCHKARSAFYPLA